MENSTSVTNVGKIGFWLSLVPWVTLPLLLALPKGAGQPPPAGQPPSTAYTLWTISFCFYCFSPIALLACINCGRITLRNASSCGGLRNM